MSMEPSQQTKRYMDSIDQDEIQNVNPASAQSIPQEVGNRSAVPVENVSVDVPSIPTPVMIKVKENSASQDSTNSSLSKMSLPSPSKWPGPYLRLQPFSMARLPHHFSFQHLEPTDIQDTQYKRPSIRLFVLSIISEALYLAKHQVPKWVRKASKTYEDVDSKVDLFEDEVFKNDITTSNGDLAKNDVRDWKQYTEPTEYWFARHSIHEDRAIPRTASWEEFIGGLRDNHSENEMAYTKEIQDARLILDYTQELEDSGLMAQIDGLTLRIFEMAHHIPICTNRVFASMVLTASISTTEFVVAQFPVDLKGYPAAFYTENKHKAKNLEPSDSKMKADVIIGSYSSVEHCQKRVNPETNESKIHWIMATASNPGGRIPLALQLLVIPGAIAKDVRFFINWTGKKRLKTSEVYTIEKKQEASTDNRMLAV